MTPETSETISLAIFDLGNVVFDVIELNAFNLWSAHTSMPPEHFAAHDVPDPVFHRFERGEISPHEFHSLFNKHKRVEMTFAEFREGWNSIYGHVYPEVEQALSELRQNVRVVALTNTNQLHCETWVPKYADVLENFEHIFISSQLNCRKPELEIYKLTLDELNTQPDKAVFFDDRDENISAALEIGIRAVKVNQPSDVVTELINLGLIKNGCTGFGAVVGCG